MTAVRRDERVEVFDGCRRRLFGIAYRMLGTPADAEDIVQDAYIRWHNADKSDIEMPEAWLTTVVTRLSIDRLRKASVQRESYIGPWLPEPIITSSAPSPEDEAEMASDLSLAFLTLLERLSPTERAVFLLHDVFDVDYTEIARVIGKSETASRQIAHRARERVQRDKPRFEPSEAERVRLIKRFAAASHAGDQKELLALFTDDVALTADGGGVVNAAKRTVFGARRLANLFTLVLAKNKHHLSALLVTVNGETGILEYWDGKPLAVTTFTLESGKITAIYRVMNPNKLKAFTDTPENHFKDALSQANDPNRLD